LLILKSKMQVLTVLGTIVGIFVLQFFESFFLALLGFRLSFVLFLAWYKRIDWKKLLPVVVVVSVAFDVTMNYRLGTNLALFVLPAFLLWLSSKIFSLESIVGLHVTNFFSSFLFYILNYILPDFLERGVFGFLDWKMVLICVVKALATTVLLWLLEVLLKGWRGRGNASQIRLK
jgi:hypothetical protein